MTTQLSIGKRYRVRDGSGKTHKYDVLNFNERSGRYTVRDATQSSPVTKRITLGHFSVVQRLPFQNQTKTQLYILKTGAGIYKIGCTDDLSARMRAGRTWCSRMTKVASRAIPYHKSGNWRRYEKKLHARFSGNRCQSGGCEVFRFTSQQVQDVTAYMKRLRFD